MPGTSPIFAESGRGEQDVAELQRQLSSYHDNLEHAILLTIKDKDIRAALQYHQVELRKFSRHSTSFRSINEDLSRKIDKGEDDLRTNEKQLREYRLLRNDAYKALLSTVPKTLPKDTGNDLTDKYEIDINIIKSDIAQMKNDIERIPSKIPLSPPEDAETTVPVTNNEPQSIMDHANSELHENIARIVSQQLEQREIRAKNASETMLLQMEADSASRSAELMASQSDLQSSLQRLEDRLDKLDEEQHKRASGTTKIAPLVNDGHEPGSSETGYDFETTIVKSKAFVSLDRKLIALVQGLESSITMVTELFHNRNSIMLNQIEIHEASISKIQADLAQSKENAEIHDKKVAEKSVIQENAFRQHSETLQVVMQNMETLSQQCTKPISLPDSDNVQSLVQKLTGGIERSEHIWNRFHALQQKVSMNAQRLDGLRATPPAQGLIQHMRQIYEYHPENLIRRLSSLEENQVATANRSMKNEDIICQSQHRIAQLQNRVDMQTALENAESTAPRLVNIQQTVYRLEQDLSTLKRSNLQNVRRLDALQNRITGEKKDLTRKFKNELRGYGMPSDMRLDKPQSALTPQQQSFKTKTKSPGTFIELAHRPNNFDVIRSMNKRQKISSQDTHAASAPTVLDDDSEDEPLIVKSNRKRAQDPQPQRWIALSTKSEHSNHVHANQSPRETPLGHSTIRTEGPPTTPPCMQSHPARVDDVRSENATPPQGQTRNTPSPYLEAGSVAPVVTAPVLQEPKGLLATPSEIQDGAVPIQDSIEPIDSITTAAPNESETRKPESDNDGPISPADMVKRARRPADFARFFCSDGR